MTTKSAVFSVRMYLWALVKKGHSLARVACPLIFCVFLAGCATPIQVARVYEELPPKPSTEVASIPIIIEKPTRAYRVIADFELSNPSDKAIKKTAAKLGADAVYVLKYPRTTTGTTVILKESTKDKGIDVVAVCSAIVYK